MTLQSVVFSFCDFLFVLFFKYLAAVDQDKELMNLLHSNSFFNLGSQSVDKFHTPRTIVLSIMIVGMIMGKVVKFGRIFAD